MMHTIRVQSQVLRLEILSLGFDTVIKIPK